MLKLSNLELSARAISFMTRWQQKIDDESTYVLQLEKAKQTWGKSNRTFNEIKGKLHKMGPGINSCAYCENSEADEIEHIYPKDIFPEKTFVWENYVYACGPCNGPKSNKFALIHPADKLLDISPPRNPPENHIPKRPPSFPAAFIDPRFENPLDFLELDIFDQFLFTPKEGLSKVDRLKANYTIELLRLNSRGSLAQNRKLAFGTYRARLKEYVEVKTNNGTDIRLAELKKDFLLLDHPTVWKEMQRNQQFIPELKNLFAQAPEALEW